MRIVTLMGLLFCYSLVLTGCTLFSAEIPTPTRALNFVTVTSPPDGGEATPSPPGPNDQSLVTATTAPAGSPSPTPPATTPVVSTPATPLSSPTAIVLTPTALQARPYAIIDSPGGSLNVRDGPGLDYGGLLGVYDNDVTVDLLGKQYSSEGRLWWLIPFPTGPDGQGWIFADYTTAYHVDRVPWVKAPDLPPTFTPPDPPPIPQAVIDSPEGFVQVRRGPGAVYGPSLGALRNGAVVDILGKQRSTAGELWWLIFFPSIPYEEGWIYANHTISQDTEQVPWVAAPPTPTPTPAPTPTPPEEPTVTWTITGRVIDATTAQPVGGASVRANLGQTGPSLVTVADSSGAFSLTASAPDRGDLTLIISAQAYTDRVLTTAPRTPRTYEFPGIELTPTRPPAITWAISGRVTEIGTAQPIPEAQVEAILGDEGVHLGTTTDADGQFSVSGEARDSGLLTVNLTAEGYQPHSFISDQTGSRIYTLTDLQLVPLAGGCAYESVLDLAEAAALARLQSLNFTTVITTPVSGSQSSPGLILTQQPEPPPEGESIRVGCQIPITLGVGVAGNAQ